MPVLVHIEIPWLMSVSGDANQWTYDFGVDSPNLGVLTFQQASAFIGGELVGQLSELLLIVGSPTESD